MHCEHREGVCRVPDSRIGNVENQCSRHAYMPEHEERGEEEQRQAVEDQPTPEAESRSSHRENQGVGAASFISLLPEVRYIPTDWRAEQPGTNLQRAGEHRSSPERIT